MTMKTSLSAYSEATSAVLPHRTTKSSPVLALINLDPSSGDTVQRAFAQCGIGAVRVGEDFFRRVCQEKFEGGVLDLNERAIPVLEAIRSSSSNRRMILYGMAAKGLELRPFSSFGINAVLDVPLDRAAVSRTARATCALLLQELRRYVRIPLVTDVGIQSGDGSFRGSSREISGGGMSVQLSEALGNCHRLRLSFVLPGRPALTIAAAVCWKSDSLFGFQFEDNDPARQLVKGWIDSFLGLA
jgi:PilZ domain